MKKLTVDDLKKRYGESFASDFTSSPGLIAETAQDIKGVGTGIAEAAKRRSSNLGASMEAQAQGKQGLGSTIFQGVGQAAGLGADVFGEIFKGGTKAILSQKQENAVKEKMGEFGKAVVSNDTIKNIVSKYEALDEKTKRNIDATLGIGSLITEVATLGGAGRGLQAGKEVISKGIKIGKEAAESAGEQTIKSLNKIAKFGQEAITPPIKPIEAAKTVLQGETKDLASGLKALSTIKTTGVKTYADLKGVITKKVTELANKVDDALLKDTTLRKLSQYVTEIDVGAGRKVRYNYVKDAIEQLKGYYSAIKDIKKLEKIRTYEQALDPIKGKGLVPKDINDIARMHGADLNAYNASGELASGLSKQAAENTRMGLKNAARKFLSGNAAQTADKNISRLKNLEALVDKNIEAVNKLKQRIQERGLIEKFGYQVSKYADILTGGSLRGFVGGLLPRGAGYKVMNALDIEKALGKNLELIEKAIKSGKDADIRKILGEIKK